MGDSTNSGAPRREPLGPVHAALLLQVLINAGTYLAGKRAMAELPPITVVLWRFLLFAVVFCLLLAFSPGPKLPPRSEWRRVLLLGLFAGPLNQVLFFYGLARSTAAHAALFYGLTPLGVYLLGLVRGQERASSRTIGGILTALAGVVVLLLGRGLAAAQGTLVGDLLILAAVLAWIVYTTEGKPFAAAHGPVRSTAWSMVAAALLLVPLTPFALLPARIFAASPPVVGSIVYLAVLTSVLAYLIWHYALSRVPASHVAIYSNLQPVVTALAAWLVLGESPGRELALGGVLVLIGVRLTQGARAVPTRVVTVGR